MCLNSQHKQPFTAAEETTVLIVGAGPSGLALSACFTKLSIQHIILEKEDCNTSLWRKNTYDRVCLHLPKDMCSLPFVPHSDEAPTFIPKAGFLKYIDDYVDRFNIKPRYNRNVINAKFDQSIRRWIVEAVNGDQCDRVVEVYESKFLVVASGENDIENIPKIDGIEDFKGEIFHSRHYKNGSRYEGKSVLVVGCGNSGMEIAFDLSNFGAHASIVARSPIHVLSKEVMRWGFKALAVFPVSVVDSIISLAARLEMGDLSKFGLHRPSKGPLHIKTTTGRSPILDVGTVAKIHSGEIKVVPAIEKIDDHKVKFSNGFEQDFEAIIMATGYKSGVSNWLNDHHSIVNKDGSLANKIPNHWKGQNGLYCCGMAKMGLLGVSKDAQLIANDISVALSKGYDSNLSYDL